MKRSSLLSTVVLSLIMISAGYISIGQLEADEWEGGRFFVKGEGSYQMEGIRDHLREMDFKMGERLKYVPYQEVIIGSPRDYQRILAIPGVERIVEEVSVENSLYISAKDVKAVPSMEYSPDTAHDIGYRGEGMTIAIIDSGVDNNNHPTFIGSFVAGADFSSPESPLNPRDGSVDPDDLDGHGTGVASVALGKGDSVGDPTYVGIAPEAGLIDLRIRLLGPTFENPIAAALEWCIDHRETDWGTGFAGIDVISISAGLGNPDGPVHQLITTCVENGMPVVSAATNSGQPFKADPNGPNYWSDDSIIVGGTDDMDTVDRSDDEFWPQSTWGPRSDDGDEDPYDELKPDISAPAVDITVAEARDKNSPGPVVGWGPSSGTSFATPHVSGAVALMLQANPMIRPSPGRNPVRTILHNTAEARGDPYDDSLSDKYNVHYGYGILDTFGAVKAAEDYIETNSPPVIRSLEVVPPRTTVGSVCTVKVDAFDPDEDILSFDISVNGGSISGSYPEYSFTAPTEPGTYTITFTATDPLSATDTAEVNVEVEDGEPNRPPLIEDLYSVPDEVQLGGTAEIHVDATDPDNDPLTYEWSSTSGEIIGNGDEVDLKAPDIVGTITIEVVVSDPFGGMDSETLRIQVIKGPGGSSPFIDRLSLDPNSIREGTSNVDVLLTARVVRMDSPIVSVHADILSMGVNDDLNLLDDGKHPDQENADSIFTGKLPPVKDLKKGTYKIEVTAVDSEGRSSSSTIIFTVQAPSGETETVGNDSGIGIGSILLIVVIFAVALIVIFVVVRLTKRDPK